MLQRVLFQREVHVGPQVVDPEPLRPGLFLSGFAYSPDYTSQFPLPIRITSKTETIQGATDNYTYGYDVAGRLETVTKNGSLMSQYTYDANGNRLTRATAAGIATYTTDNQDRLITWNLTYNPNGELHSKTKGTETTTYQYDVVGNLRHVTTGAIAQRLDNDELGSITRETNPAFQRFGFAGGLLDNQTKLTPLGARDYHPETGRWTSKIPCDLKAVTPSLRLCHK